MIAMAHKTRVKVVIAGDTHHVCPINDLRAVIKAGLSPRQALKCATNKAVELLGFEREIASIETMKVADPIVVEGDTPTVISALSQVTMIIKCSHFEFRPTTG